MRLAFFVKDVDTEIDEYATTRLARAAARSGHEVWYVGAEDVNAESTGGLQSVEWLYEIDICPTVIEALERRTGSKS